MSSELPKLSQKEIEAIIVQDKVLQKLIDIFQKDAGTIDSCKTFCFHVLFTCRLLPGDTAKITELFDRKKYFEGYGEFFRLFYAKTEQDKRTIGTILAVLEELVWTTARDKILATDWTEFGVVKKAGESDEKSIGETSPEKSSGISETKSGASSIDVTDGSTRSSGGKPVSAVRPLSSNPAVDFTTIPKPGHQQPFVAQWATNLAGTKHPIFHEPQEIRSLQKKDSDSFSAENLSEFWSKFKISDYNVLEILPFWKNTLLQPHIAIDWPTISGQIHLNLCDLGYIEQAHTFSEEYQTFLDEKIKIYYQKINEANTFLETKEFEKALKMIKSVYKQQRITFGSNHPLTLDTASRIPNLLLFLKRMDEAADWAGKVFDLRSTGIGEYHEGIGTLAIAKCLSRCPEVKEKMEDLNKVLGGSDDESESGKGQEEIINTQLCQWVASNRHKGANLGHLSALLKQIGLLKPAECILELYPETTRSIKSQPSQHYFGPGAFVFLPLPPDPNNPGGVGIPGNNEGATGQAQGLLEGLPPGLGSIWSPNMEMKGVEIKSNPNSPQNPTTNSSKFVLSIHNMKFLHPGSVQRTWAKRDLFLLRSLFYHRLNYQYLEATDVLDVEVLAYVFNRFGQMLREYEGQVEGIFIIISSHGRDTNLEMCGGEPINTYGLVTQFFLRLPQFADIPKIFIFEACLVGEYRIFEEQTQLKQTLVGFSTTPGRISYGSPQEGDVYLLLLVEAIGELMFEKNLHELLDETRNRLQRKFLEFESLYQVQFLSFQYPHYITFGPFASQFRF